MHATQVKVSQVLRTWVFRRVYYFYSLRQCDITLILDVFFPSCKRFLSLVNIFFHCKCNPLFVPHLKRCIVCMKSFSCTLSFPLFFFVVHCTNATFPLGLFDLIRLRHFIWNRKIKKQVTNPTFACETKQKSNWISTIEHVNIGKEVSAYCSKQHIVRHKPTTHYTQRKISRRDENEKRNKKKNITSAWTS